MNAAASRVFAGFWRRFAAFVVDFIIVYFAVMLGGVVLAVFASHAPDAIYAVSCVAIACIYFAGYHSSARQATPGKRMLKIKVTDVQGGRIGFATAVVRFFATWLSALPFMLGYILAAFSPRRRALHDMIAQTLVVNEMATAEDVVAGGGVMPLTAGVVAVIIIPIVGAAALAAISIDAFRKYEDRARSHNVK